MSNICLDNLQNIRISKDSFDPKDLDVFYDQYGFNLPEDVVWFFKKYYWGFYLCELIWFFPGNYCKDRNYFIKKMLYTWPEFSKECLIHFKWIINEDRNRSGFGGSFPTVENIFPIASHVSGDILFLHFWENQDKITNTFNYKLFILMGERGPVVNLDCSFPEFIHNFINNKYAELFEEDVPEENLKIEY